MRALVAAVLVGAVALLLGRRDQVARAPIATSAPTPVPPDEQRAVLTRLRLPLSAVAVLAGWIVIGGPAGIVCAAVAGALSWRVLSRVEAPGRARRRRELERDLPIAVHLFGAALAAGASIPGALDAVAEALPGPVGEEFVRVRHGLELGIDPVSVWRAVQGPLLPLGRSMARAQETGALVVAAVDRIGEELRATARLGRDAKARTVEVRAAAPLGVCFLPAFVLLGVIPMVVGIFSSLKLFG